jgi:hypothetical protein
MLGVVSAAGSLGTLVVPLITQALLARAAWQIGALFFLLLPGSRDAAGGLLGWRRRPSAGAQSQTGRALGPVYASRFRCADACPMLSLTLSRSGLTPYLGPRCLAPREPEGAAERYRHEETNVPGSAAFPVPALHCSLFSRDWLTRAAGGAMYVEEHDAGIQRCPMPASFERRPSDAAKWPRSLSYPRSANSLECGRRVRRIGSSVAERAKDRAVLAPNEASVYISTFPLPDSAVYPPTCQPPTTRSGKLRRPSGAMSMRRRWRRSSTTCSMCRVIGASGKRLKRWRASSNSRSRP